MGLSLAGFAYRLALLQSYSCVRFGHPIAHQLVTFFGPLRLGRARSRPCSVGRWARRLGWPLSSACPRSLWLLCPRALATHRTLRTQKPRVACAARAPRSLGCGRHVHTPLPLSPSPRAASPKASSGFALGGRLAVKSTAKILHCRRDILSLTLEKESKRMVFFIVSGFAKNASNWRFAPSGFALGC